MTILLNIPSLLTLFNCILNEKLFDSFFECFNEGSSDIFYINYILSFFISNFVDCITKSYFIYI